MSSTAANERRLPLFELPKPTVSWPPALGDVVDQLVRDRDLTSYDAIHLAIALEHELPLATRDDALAAAARDVGVARFSA